MTPRARNNAIAGLIVVVFWLALVIPTIVHAVDESSITQNTTSTVTTSGTNETTVKSPPPSAISPNVGGNNVIGTIIGLVGQLGDAGLVGIIAAALIWRLLDDDIKNDLKK